MSNSIQNVKIIHILLFKKLSAKRILHLICRDGKKDRKDKYHCIILLRPRMYGLMWKIKITNKLLIVHLKESRILIGREDFGDI